MNKLTVYIVTDANRKFLEVGVTSLLTHVIYELNNHNKALFSSFSPLNRIVYYQFANSDQEAEKIANTLKGYTRMQLERLIRKANPNWLNLGTQSLEKETKKVVAYALAT